MLTNAASLHATAEAMTRAESATALVFVEGITDRIALEASAELHGRDLTAERVVIVPIGGAHAIARTLEELGPITGRIPLTGLCDLKEAEIFRREVDTFVCADDLEDELIRAVGRDGVTALFAAQHDLGAFRTFQKQPAWRGQALPAQMYRFIRSSSRRNLRYARLLVEAAGVAALPRPLTEALAATDLRQAA
jgi:hypothetical protein